jgi:DNA-nicking Smr family endonuclease
LDGSRSCRGKSWTDDDPIEIPIEDSLDLHAFLPNEVRDVCHEYLLAARERGFREVRLIHGRGRGVQRANIQSLLRGLDFVETFRDDAHLGATVVVLRMSS